MVALIAVPRGDLVWRLSVQVLLEFGAIRVPYRLDGECDEVDFEYCGSDGSLLRGGVRAVEDNDIKDRDVYGVVVQLRH